MRFVLLLLLMLWPATTCSAKENLWEVVDEVDQAFESSTEVESDFSMKEYVKNIYEGKKEFSPRDIFANLGNQIKNMWKEKKSSFVQFLLLGVMSGLCANFSDVLGKTGGGQLSFYMIYGVVVATLMTGFYEVYDVAQNAVEQLFAFLQTLIPSFSLALCAGGSIGTALGFYEIMLVAMTALQWVMKYIFLPMVELYFILCLLNPLAEQRFTKLAELCEKGIKVLMKASLMSILGYQGIQGLLLPVMDKVKNNSLLNAAKGIPGIGNSLGGAADTLVGSGILIKSALGVGGLICLLVMAVIPLAKMGIFTLLYRLTAALVQPVSDKRISDVLWNTANCGKMLFHGVFVGALVFFLSIVIVLSATNLI